MAKYSVDEDVAKGVRSMAYLGHGLPEYTITIGLVHSVRSFSLSMVFMQGGRSRSTSRLHYSFLTPVDATFSPHSRWQLFEYRKLKHNSLKIEDSTSPKSNSLRSP